MVSEIRQQKFGQIFALKSTVKSIPFFVIFSLFMFFLYFLNRKMKLPIGLPVDGFQSWQNDPSIMTDFFQIELVNSIVQTVDELHKVPGRFDFFAIQMHDETPAVVGVDDQSFVHLEERKYEVSHSWKKDRFKTHFKPF